MLRGRKGFEQKLAVGKCPFAHLVRLATLRAGRIAAATEELRMAEWKLLPVSPGLENTWNAH